MQQNNDNIRHHANPVKQTRWHSLIMTLLLTVYMLITAPFALANVLPVVSITSPANNATATAPVSVTITANASDSDGTITQVAFYANGGLVGVDTTAPYSANVSNVPAGSYTLTAIATDNNNETTTSSAVQVTVNAASNTPPTVALTAPTNNAAYTQGTAITLTANAADSDGTIAKVEFYDGATLINTDTTAPYSYSWTSATLGTHSITAKATDNSSAVTTSAAVSVTVNAASNIPPTVALTAPTNNAAYTQGAAITLTANAADSDGTIAKVEFYDGATLINTDTTAPYSYSWTSAAAGTHSITAQATDNSSAVTTSAAVSVTVNAAANTPPTVSITSPVNNASATAPASVAITANASDSDGTITQVAFYANGGLVGVDTTAPYSVNVSNVPVGSYTLTAIATDNSNGTTTSSAIQVTVTVNANTPPTVTITSPANNSSYTQGASVPLAATAADSDGSIIKVEFYDGTTLLNTDTTAPYSYSWTSATLGAHSITAKATDNSSAVTTSAAVNVTVSAAANIPPIVTLTSPVNNSSYNQGDSMPFAATATDSDGTIVKVEFYDGSTLIYTATTAPYSIGVVASTIGSHTVTAVATDNNGATAISNAAQVTINAVVNTTPQAYYIHTDQLNTPRLITDNNNQAVWRWDNWEPFGNYITDEDPGNTGNKFTYNPRFAGQYYDIETGLSYNYFRDYNPQTGRYIESDPIGLGGGQFSTYAYVDGMPLRFTDPTGLIGEAKIVELLTKGGMKVKNLVCKEAAVEARKKGQNVLAPTRQKAKEIEKAANNGKPIMRHDGHDLPDGSTGKPHFQSEGQKGHTFYGVGIAGATESGYSDEGITGRDLGEGLLDLLTSPLEAQ